MATHTRMRWGFKSKKQLPLFMIWKEIWERGEVVHAHVLFNSMNYNLKRNLKRRLLNSITSAVVERMQTDKSFREDMSELIEAEVASSISDIAEDVINSRAFEREFTNQIEQAIDRAFDDKFGNDEYVTQEDFDTLDEKVKELEIELEHVEAEAISPEDVVGALKPAHLASIVLEAIEIAKGTH